MDKHYNPAISRCLQTYAASRDWQGLLVYLQGCSNAQFRTAGYMLAERILPSLAEPDVWELTSTLVSYNSRAFLVTLLKAIAVRLSDDTLQLHSEGCCNFLHQVASNPLDVQKTLLQLLPVIASPHDIQWLFRQVGIEEGEPQVPYLMRTATLPAAYALFHTLHRAEHNRSLLLRVTYMLMKRGDGVGFNLASLLRTYYGLEEVKGTFSLQIQPYQLARIANSYDAFRQLMKW